MRKSITVSKDLNDDLRAYSKSQGISQSQLFEVALRMYLTHQMNSNESLKPLNKKKKSNTKK